MRLLERGEEEVPERDMEGDTLRRAGAAAGA